jgi:hypothetical protein
MKLLEFTIVGINPDDCASWNGTEVPARITITDETMYICIVLPPPDRPLVERLLPEFAKIEANLPRQSRKILEYLLDTDVGWATHQDLLDEVWVTSRQLTGGIRKQMDAGENALHQAIHRLNNQLRSLNFGYIVESRNSVCYLVPDKR